MAAEDDAPPRWPALDVVTPPEPWSGWVGGPMMPGVVWTPLPRHQDERGWFTKVFQRSALIEAGGDAEVAEVYLSGSGRGVVRGLHYQSPPNHHAKSVAVVEGAVLDVVVDLRRGSPTEGAVARLRLDAERPGRLHLQAGLAHGFQVLSPHATMVYVVSSEHAPDHDHGIRFDSVGVRWPIEPVTVGERDAALPTLRELASPFTYEGAPGAS